MRRFALLVTLVCLFGGCNLYADLDRPTGESPTPDAGGNDGGTTDGGNTNACTPQSDLEFCNIAGADCGEVTDFDNCGNSRTVNCGVCTDGSTCGERQPNVCGCPCDIDGTCVADGAINSANECEVCNPVANSMGWSPRTGAVCTNGDLCAEQATCSDQAVCETTTPVDCATQVGECIDATCDPADGVCKGDPVADNTPCSDDGLTCTDDVCLAGVCEHPAQTGFCVADGECLQDGESPAGNSCVTCTGAPVMLSNATAGTSCGAALSCASQTCDGMGACIAAVDPGSCAIDGTCYADGTMNPSNRCQFCDVGNSQTAWTDEPGGTSCRNPNCTCGTSPFTSEFTCLRPNGDDCN